MAEPGFPVGGRRAIGGANLRHRHFSVKKYAKTKELDPIGGGGEDAGSAPWIRQSVLCPTKPSNNKSIIENWEHASEKVPFSVKLAMPILYENKARPTITFPSFDKFPLGKVGVKTRWI